jgi:hypothetical protein
MEVTITSNAKALALVMGGLARDQLPFASAQALTTLAFMGQRETKSELIESLTTRNRYSATGIQVNRAEKGDWPNQTAEVGIEKGRSYLIDHVTAGKRQGGTYGRAILEDESLRGSSGRIARKNRPGAMIKRARGGRRKGSKNGDQATPLPFIIQTTSKWNNEVLVRRQGPERYPLQILYAFKRGVAIKREFEMDVAVQLAVKGNYSQVLGKALAKAIASAKSKHERRTSGSAGGEIPSGR